MITALAVGLAPPAASARRISGNANPPSVTPPSCRQARREIRTPEAVLGPLIVAMRDPPATMRQFKFKDWEAT